MKEFNFYGEGCLVYAQVGRFNSFGDNVKIGMDSPSSETDVKIGNSCTFGNNVEIRRNVVIGNNVTIEAGVVIPSGCKIGNGATIHSGVTLGENTIIHENCVFRGDTTIGENNEFLPGSIIGFWPKDIGDPHYEGKIVIADNNFFGEHTVINVGEATDKGNVTAIGSSVYSMDFVTINHNDQVAVGNEIPLNPKRSYTTILSSKVSLAGHVEVGVGANIGMQATAHQFSVIGAGAMIGMNASVAKNVPPFALVIGNKVAGINKRPLAENLDFGSYDDDLYGTVRDILASVTNSDNTEEAQRKMESYRNSSSYNKRALAVVEAFLNQDQNKRKMMKRQK